MFSEFFFGILYFFREHFFIHMLFIIVGLVLSFVALISNIRVKIILSLLLPFIVLTAMIPFCEDYIQTFGRSVYSIDYIAELVESGSMTEEQAKKYLHTIASHNEKKEKEWLEEKRQEVEEKHKELESQIKTKEIQKRLEDEYKNIVGGIKK